MTRPNITFAGDRLLVAPADDARADRATELLLEGAPLREVFIALQQEGAPAFALAQHDDDVRIVVAGTYAADAVSEHGITSVEVASDAIAAHSEATVPAGSLLRIADDGRPLVTWVPSGAWPSTAQPSTASPVFRDVTEPPVVRAEDPRPHGSPPAAPAPPDPEAGGSDQQAEQAEPPPPVFLPPKDSPAVPAPPSAGPAGDVTYVRPSSGRPASSTPEADESPARSGDATDTTLHEPHQWAPPRPEERVEHVPGADEDGRSGPPPTDGLITHVPWKSGATSPAPSVEPPARPTPPQAPGARPPAPAPPSAPPRHEPDDGHTVPAASLRAKVEAARRAGQHGTPSRVCPQGHTNPPTATSCRSCGDELRLEHERAVPRPVIARLVFEDGLVPPVEVDRTQVIGRRPRTREDQPGLQPGLVTVPDGEREISGAHVELRVHGWTMDVVDLDSTNGTWITLPGQEEVRLRPEDPTVVTPGTIVRLAGVTSFRVEEAQ